MSRAGALLATLALAACQITPGLTVRCDGRCRISPANLRVQPEPGHHSPAR